MVTISSAQWQLTWVATAMFGLKYRRSVWFLLLGMHIEIQNINAYGHAST